MWKHAVLELMGVISGPSGDQVLGWSQHLKRHRRDKKKLEGLLEPSLISGLFSYKKETKKKKRKFPYFSCQLG